MAIIIDELSAELPPEGQVQGGESRRPEQPAPKQPDEAALRNALRQIMRRERRLRAE